MTTDESPDFDPGVKMPDNVIVSCDLCGWNDSANRGDLVLSTQDTDGNCVAHQVLRFAPPPPEREG